MSELSPEARALIDEATRSDGPNAEDRERVRNKLAMTLGASAFASGAGPLAFLSQRPADAHAER